MESVTYNINGYFEPKMAQDFLKFADSLTEPCVVALEIRSEGGQVPVLETIVNRISQMKEQGFVFITNVDNYAYSCAFALFLVGDMKFASDTAKFLQHPPFLEGEGKININDAKEIYDVLSEAQKISDNIILNNTNISQEAFNLLKKNETFMDREDLIYLGLMEKEYKY